MYKVVHQVGKKRKGVRRNRNGKTEGKWRRKGKKKEKRGERMEQKSGRRKIKVRKSLIFFHFSLPFSLYFNIFASLPFPFLVPSFLCLLFKRSLSSSFSLLVPSLLCLSSFSLLFYLPPFPFLSLLPNFIFSICLGLSFTVLFPFCFIFLLTI